MRFVSARRKADDSRSYSFSEAVLMGYADDGGMLLPETVPVVVEPTRDDNDASIKGHDETLQKWAALDYPHLVVEVLKVSTSSRIELRLTICM